jgi:hypothetical protein
MMLITRKCLLTKFDFKRFLEAHKMFESLERRRREASELDRLQQQHGRDLTPSQQQQQQRRNETSSQQQQHHGGVPKELQQQQEYSGSIYEDSHIYEEITEAVKVG